MVLRFKSNPDYRGGTAHDPERGIIFVRKAGMYKTQDSYEIHIDGNVIAVSPQRFPSLITEGKLIHRWVVPRVGCVYKSEEDKSKFDRAAVEALVREVIEIGSINRLTPERRANVERVDIDFSQTVWVLS